MVGTLREAQQNAATGGASQDVQHWAARRVKTLRFCERVLKRPKTAIEQLARLSVEELTRLASQLQNEVERLR